MSLQTKLEQIEENGQYGVVLYYGGEIGLDDFEIPREERTIAIFGTPLKDENKKRKEWKGTLNDLNRMMNENKNMNEGETLEDIIEKIKIQRNYGITLYYNIGKKSIPQEKEIMIIGVPVGCMAGARKMWKGTINQLKQINFEEKPTLMNNPPKVEEYKNSGHYIWGSDSSVRKYL